MADTDTDRAEFWTCLAIAVVAIVIIGVAINDAFAQYPTRSGPFWSPQDWERRHGSLRWAEERERKEAPHG